MKDGSSADDVEPIKYLQAIFNLVNGLIIFLFLPFVCEGLIKLILSGTEGLLPAFSGEWKLLLEFLKASFEGSKVSEGFIMLQVGLLPLILELVVCTTINI